MALVDITPTGDLAADVTSLMEALAQVSTDKHNAAIAAQDAQGLATRVSAAQDAQSHAYANAAMWLERLLDAHAAK